MVKFKIKKGDTVKVIAGDDKGKVGKVLFVYPFGIAFLTDATITSPTVAYLLWLPPKTLIHIISFAPLLSATFNRVKL